MNSVFDQLNSIDDEQSINKTEGIVPKELYHISLTVDPQLKWDRTYQVRNGGARTLTVRYLKRTKDFTIDETKPSNIYDDCTLRFLSADDAQEFIDKYVKLSPTEIAKVKKSQLRPVVKIESSEFTAVPLYTSLTYIERNVPALLS